MTDDEGSAPLSEEVDGDSSAVETVPEASLAEDAPTEPGGVEGDEPFEVRPVPPPSLRPPTVYCPLRVERVEVLLPATHARLVLQEIEGLGRYLQIPIGLPEASAIALASQGLETPRPLTHELFSEVLLRYHIVIETVRITAATESSFRAELVLSGPSGPRVLDCRPSDGIALALRQVLPVPITVAESVLDQLGTAEIG